MQLRFGGVVIPLPPQQVQGIAMLGNQENSTFTSQKVRDWLIIYSFAM